MNVKECLKTDEGEGNGQERSVLADFHFQHASSHRQQHTKQPMKTRLRRQR